jgi:antitoxin PrlF
MAKARSKVTAQNQITVPAEIRRKLGIGPGTVLEWEGEGTKAVVRKAGGYTFKEMREILFPDGPPPRKSLKELKDAVGDYIAEKYARR